MVYRHGAINGVHQVPEERPNWEVWAMGIAFAVSLRADCRRSRVGAVVLDSEKRVIATGYNGTKPGKPGCLAGECPRGLLSYAQLPSGGTYDDPNSLGFCIAVHAEMNAVLAADPLRIKDGLLAVTCKPCDKCMRQIQVTPLYRVIWPARPNWDAKTFFTLALSAFSSEHEIVEGMLV